MINVVMTIKDRPRLTAQALRSLAMRRVMAFEEERQKEWLPSDDYRK